MKNTDNLSDLTNEELLRKLKSAKAIYIVFFSLFIIMLVCGLYITATKGFGVFTILPITFIPLLIANIMNYGKIKEEAKSRNIF